MMSEYVIDVRIKRCLGFTGRRAWLKRIIISVLGHEKIVGGAEVGCVITDDATVYRLNRIYRGIDRTTDVLSFAFSEVETGDESIVFPNVPDAGTSLGEIIISYPQASRQAPVHGNTIEEELTLLIVHGTLHLLGYDHNNTEDARIMRNRERTIISLLDK